jgi:hypothetical protein
MTEWYVYQPNGEHIGPVSTELLARAMVGGKIPPDAHIGAKGDAHWQVIAEVAEIQAAVAAYNQQAPAPVSQMPATIPPAPPPTQTIPPTPTIPPAPLVPQIAAPTPPTSSSLLIPLGIFMACAALSLLLFVVSLAVHPGEAEPTPRAAHSGH